MSSGVARGSNPRQKMIYGRENLNYAGVNRANDEPVSGSVGDVSEGFVTNPDAPMTRTIEDIRIKKFKNMDTTLLVTILMDFVKNNNVFDEDEIHTALDISSTLHINDFRKSARSPLKNPPYMEHVLRVAVRPMKHFDCHNHEVVLSALLHDTVEDHCLDFAPVADELQARNILLDYYEDEFGSSVRDAVSGLTNPLLEPGLSKEEKRRAYREHVMEATSNNDTVLMVKTSDFIDNAGSLYLTNKKGEGSTEHLVKKYTPMVDFFKDTVKDSSYSDITKNSLIERLDNVGETLATLR